ncbi:TPA: hypothetical protein ACMDSS_003651 [Vibrio parahaemolyticus]
MSETGKTRVYVFTLKVKKARLVTVLRFKHQWLAYMTIKHLKKRFWFAELTFKQITPLNALWYFFQQKATKQFKILSNIKSEFIN